MSTEKTQKDPDNVIVSAGKKDASMSYVFVPFNYRDAQAALKEAGAKWAGNTWGIDSEAFKESEEKIREAARQDIALGQEGRKAREETLKAAKEADAEAKKAAKADKPELTEEEKAAKAEASRAAAIQRDATRVPVIEGSVAEGDTIQAGGADVQVAKLGTAWALETDEQVSSLKERFPDVGGIEKGARVQFANFEAPEAELESPGM